MTDNTPSPSNSEDEIDLKDLIIPIWNARKQILTTAIIFAIFGGIIGFLTPATYTASSIFLPQTSQASGTGGGSLGGLAALAGINLNTGPGGGGEIAPSLYATVLASSPFQKRILDSKISINGDSITYRDYLSNSPSSGLSILQKYTIGLPGTILSFFSKVKPSTASDLEITGLVPLADNEYNLRNSLAGKINITNDKKEGFVSLSVVEGNPLIAAQVAKVTEQVLQDWIIEHKIKNAKAQYEFIEKQFEEKQKEFFSIQEQLANYTDRNQNILAASYLTRLDRMQAEFDLVNTVYSELAKQKEQAAIQLSKDTPTFSILNPVEVPKEKTGPKKSLFILGAFFIGLIASAVWALGYKPVQGFLKVLQKSPKANSN
uniref:Wzz/FepE/Etk N-terminal domain-containing protein n=1 Tax=Algoriphagus sp. TaxID=1872435 RepID=UPI0040482226